MTLFPTSLGEGVWGREHSPTVEELNS